MYKQWKLGACLPLFAQCADRYCLSGYGRGATTVEGMLAAAKTVKHLDGLEWMKEQPGKQVVYLDYTPGVSIEQALPVA